MHVYETTHPVAHSADEMFALVARVEDYPRFLPLCEALEIKRRDVSDGKEVIVAKMTVGYGLIRESFTTKVHLDPPARKILVEYLDGPFTFLENRWHFQPRGSHSCDVAFYIAYAFSSRLFERLVGRLFAKAVERYTRAFEARADAVYGRNAAALASQQ
ncbi:MAG TPA: type II toxin-antitoxin system RatA family toxin [Methyloceanibacter sp.]|jgi:coenzyme Q-binding protein COQ10|nr:type II toxin-antitoxin system RatA family toxin [Methyloceanibacter sp.]